MRTLLALVLLALVCGCQWSPTPQDSGYLVHGRVVDAETQQGLVNVEVKLWRSGRSELVACTDTEGWYSRMLVEASEEPPRGLLIYSKSGYRNASFEHDPTDSYLAMQLGWWSTAPDVVELAPN